MTLAETSLLPMFAPFPVDVLPDVIRDYASSEAEGMDCDPLMIATPALGIFAGAVGTSVRIRVHPSGWQEPCALWFGLIALAGSMKTQTQDAAAFPMQESQCVADKEYEAAEDRYQQELSYWEAKARKSDTPSAPKPEEPLRCQCLVSDSTPEALAHVLRGSPRGVVSIHDELAALFGGLGRYNKGAGGAEPGAAFYKSAYNGSTFTENRKGENGRGKYLRLESPLVSIVGAIQPDAFQRVVSAQYIHDGLASRFNWAWPPDRPAGWPKVRVKDASIRSRYAEAYNRLASIPLRTDQDGKRSPFIVELSDAATEKAKEWVNFLQRRMRDESRPAIRAALAKLKGGAFRIALVFHLTEWASRGGTGDIGSVSADTLDRALTLARWYAQEAERVYGMHSETKEQQQRRGLVELIGGKGGTISCSELVQSRRAYATVPDAEAALDDLITNGYGSWQTPAQRGPGAPKARRFVLAAGVYSNPAGDSASGNSVDIDAVDDPKGEEWGEVP